MCYSVVSVCLVDVANISEKFGFVDTDLVLSFIIIIIVRMFSCGLGEMKERYK